MRTPLLFVCIVPLVISAGKFAQAQNQPQSRKVQFVITSSDELEHAYGLLILDPLVTTPTPATSENEDVQALVRPEAHEREAKIEKLKNNEWRIEVQLKKADLSAKRQSKVTAIARTKDGKIIPTDVRALGKLDSVPAPAPVCEADSNAEKEKRLLNLSEDHLKQVVEVRAAKEEILRKYLNDLLSDQVLAQLAERETKLRLIHDKPLSRDLPLPELLSRISTLEAMSR